MSLFLRLLVVFSVTAGLTGVATPTSAVTGTRPWVVVLCSFSDHPEQPRPASHYQGLVDETGRGGAYDYFRDVSNAQLDLTGSIVKGWYRLPMTRDKYNGLARGGKITVCAQAAKPEVDYSRYYGVIAITNQTTSTRVDHRLVGAVDAATTRFTVDDVTGYPPVPFAAFVSGPSPTDATEKVEVTAITDNTLTVTRAYECCPGGPVPHRDGATVSYDSFAELGAVGDGPVRFGFSDGTSALLGAVIAGPDVDVTGLVHEMGHGLALPHSRRASTSWQDYGDCYDMMSAYSCVYQFPGSYAGLSGVARLAAPQVDRAGWLPAGRKRSMGAPSCTPNVVELVSLSHPEVAGTQLLTVPAATRLRTHQTDASLTRPAQALTFEYRTKEGWDRSVPDPAVVVHYLDSDGTAYLADAFGAEGALRSWYGMASPADGVYVTVNGFDTERHTATLTVAGCPIPAEIRLVSVPPTAVAGEPYTVSGRLVVAGTDLPLAGRFVRVRFGRDDVTCRAFTRTDGGFSCTEVLNGTGDRALTFSFEGDDVRAPAEATASVTVEPDRARLTVTPAAPSVDYSDPVAVSVRLTDADDDRALGGRSVTVSGVGDVCTALTDGAGTGTCTLTASVPAGPTMLRAQWTGDENYAPAEAASAFQVTREQVEVSSTTPAFAVAGQPVTLSGRLVEDGTSPVPGRSLQLRLGTRTCTGTTGPDGVASCGVPWSEDVLGPQPLTVTFAGDGYYEPDEASSAVTLFAFPAGGAFAVGDGSASDRVTWWSANWSDENRLSAGRAPRAFKGFTTPTTGSVGCGGEFTAAPGASSNPPSRVPEYQGVVVTDRVQRSGGTLSGQIVRVVVVHNAPGYSASLATAGTGTVLGSYC